MPNRWRGFQSKLTVDSMHKGRYKVEFWPNELAGTGEMEPKQSGTVVMIEDQGELTVIGFHADARQIVDMQRGDFEERAIEIVREHREGS